MENEDNKQQDPTEPGETETSETSETSEIPEISEILETSETSETREIPERVDSTYPVGDEGKTRERRALTEQDSIADFITEDNVQQIIDGIIEGTNLSDLETDEDEEDSECSGDEKPTDNEELVAEIVPEVSPAIPSMTTILESIKSVLNTEDTKEKVLQETKKLLLGVISQEEKEKLSLKYEGHSEWENRKKQANTNNGKIGEYDFSYIFKVYEGYDDSPKEEDVMDGPSSSGQPLPPPPPPAAPGPPPPPGKGAPGSGPDKKLKKLHWSGLPPTQTKGDTIWSSSAKVDWDKKYFGQIFTEQKSGVKIKERHQSAGAPVVQDDVPDTVFDNQSAFVIELAIKKLPSMSKLKIVIDELRDNDPSITFETIANLQKMCEKYNPEKSKGKEEENLVQKIKKKKKVNPDIKLAKPDQWIFDLFSINHLELKLKIFSFRFRFCLEVESICASLKSLELALTDVRSCEPFIQIIKLILEVGNFLNGKEDSGFNILDFLPKINDIKDVATNKPLLHHVIKELSKTNFKIVHDFYGESNLKTMQSTVFFHREDSKSKEKETTLLEKIEKIDVVCREFMVELNESLSVENKRILEPFFDDAAEKITKMKKGIDILNIEYGKFLIWLGIPPSSHKNCTAGHAAEVLLNLRKEVITVADKIKEEERTNDRKPGDIRQNSSEMRGLQGGDKVVDITEALKLKFSGRKFSTRRVRKSVKGYLNKN